MMTSDTSTVSTVAHSGVAVTALAFLHTALLNMVPYLICAIPLIILDCRWGVPAARKRKENVTFSRGFRMVMTKSVDYICWVVVASSLALAFETGWLEWLILGAVMGNEIISIVGNYLYVKKDVELSWENFYRWVFKAGAEKMGATMDAAEAEGIIRKKEKEEGDE
ncbi:MAG: phage holin family protein [Clostridia bacterium]|nr:phage holin family protein [Clostridia bacterium]